MTNPISDYDKKFTEHAEKEANEGVRFVYLGDCALCGLPINAYNQSYSTGRYLAHTICDVFLDEYFRPLLKKIQMDDMKGSDPRAYMESIFHGKE